ncbi:MAG: FAD-dependent oxidoreductase [Nitrospirae bacterium]|nr:FAD-dependent oxidoreductase [Nitrospirota bacterium]
MNTSCDVLVIGAGVSGVAAAVAAARAGAKIILTEKENFLGGVGYSGLHQYICGLYLNGEAIPGETLNEGVVREIVGLLNKLSPQRTIKKIGQVYVLPYSGEDLAVAFGSLCRNEKNLKVFFNTSAVEVKKKNKMIVEVILSNDVEKSPHPPFHKGAGIPLPRSIATGSGGITSHKIIPKIVIDCTGSGDISAMAGASFELSPRAKRQLAGFTVRLEGLKDSGDILSIKVPYYLSQAVNKKLLPAYLRFTAFSAGETDGEGFCKINVGGPDSARREQTVRKDALKMINYLAKKLPSFKGAYIAETSLRVMEREGRRVCGEYTLTEDDVLNAGKFDDGVVKNSWPMEIWDKKKGTIYKYVKTGDYYEIPFRCLKARGIHNLLLAGRCISVTREVLGSTRVMGTCISLGEEAGKAAAYYLEKGKYPFL